MIVSDLRECTLNNQKLLKKLGYDPGPLDGIPGRRTALALSEALDEDGFMPNRDKLRAHKAAVTGGMNWPSQSRMHSFYGPPGTGHTKLDLPYPFRLAWDLNTVVNRITVHKKCADSTRRVLEEVLRCYGMEKIEQLRLNVWGGTFNDRNMRGGKRKSTHAYACAHDFDPVNNQLKWGRDKASFARPEYEAWWKIWESEGWVSLGRARNFDWMHIQAARL